MVDALRMNAARTQEKTKNRDRKSTKKRKTEIQILVMDIVQIHRFIYILLYLYESIIPSYDSSLARASSLCIFILIQASTVKEAG